MERWLFALIFVFTSSIYAFGQELAAPSPVTYVDYTFYYPCGSSAIDSTYETNPYVLAQIADHIQAEASGEIARLCIAVRSTASPLGNERSNLLLSEQRASALKEYLLQRFPNNRFPLDVVGVGVDWPLLTQLIDTATLESKAQLQHIIQTEQQKDRRNLRLMEVRYGRPYRQMMQDLFPAMQASFITLTYQVVPPRVVADTAAAILEPVYDTPPPTPEQDTFADETSDPIYRPLFNVSTNALYWAALAPNIGFELFKPDSRWSIHANYFMPWWKNNAQHRYYQIWQTAIEPRLWLKDGGLYRGHFFGLYGHGGKYDLENRHTGYQGRFLGGGITYGYSLPIKKRFSLEFALGVGYIDLRYEQYVPVDNHYVYEQTVHTGYFGPTKVRVGLVWTLDFQSDN